MRLMKFNRLKLTNTPVDGPGLYGMVNWVATDNGYVWVNVAKINSIYQQMFLKADRNDFYVTVITLGGRSSFYVRETMDEVIKMVEMLK